MPTQTIATGEFELEVTELSGAWIEAMMVLFVGICNWVDIRECGQDNLSYLCLRRVVKECSIS